MRTVFFALLMVVLLSTASALAQNTGGAIDGTVTDADGKPLVGAVITTRSPTMSVMLTTASAKDGYFRFIDLPPGTIDVTVAYEGFQTAEVPGAVVRLGHTTSLGPIRLSEKAFEIPALVVSGSAIPIDTYSPAVGDDLLRREFEDLPLDRDYRYLATLLPEVHTSFLGDDV